MRGGGLSCQVPLFFYAAYLKVGGNPSSEAECWEPLVTGERKRLWEPIGQDSSACLSVPHTHPLPVIVLADAPHSPQGLQVVVGLAGAEAVQ